MRKMMVAATAMVLLAGCGDEANPAKDAADVAEINAMHDMPAVQPLTPESIAYSDVEKFGLSGAGCSFAPDGGIAVVFIGQGEHGYMLQNGKVVDFAPDKGSARLPVAGYEKYDGKEFAVALKVTGEPGDGITASQYPGSMTVTDSKGRVVYDKKGALGCGS
ncbi:hypothetical protein [Croceicoccus sp. BE223]|uniref:hypothetical protein n=1 Tax=Croceicoccus sp. BE223 TaxID=2817716 RepID=UPI002863012E|nr:hypothetical protein [Croceicoccus sp. BE223]MDR7103197.1 hypothetical protein [Croceicoccus sp. BE223]